MTELRNDGGPALPAHRKKSVSDDGCTYEPAHYLGMSLRDYFAAAALQGMWSGQFIYCDDTPEVIEMKKNAKTMEDRLKISDDEDDHCVYHANITHNLGDMAEAAGLYIYLWCPEEHGIALAHQLIDPLREGLARFKASPKTYTPLNPANGWGSYDGLVRFVENYLKACESHPQAEVSVWR